MRSFDHPKRVAIREHLGLLHDHPMRAVAGGEEELIKLQFVILQTPAKVLPIVVARSCIRSLQIIVEWVGFARGFSRQSPPSANPSITEFSLPGVCLADNQVGCYASLIKNGHILPLAKQRS